MKRFPVFILPLILLLAVAPIPALASGGGGGGEGVQAEETAGFNNASGFFALFFQSGGNLGIVLAQFVRKPVGTPARATWGEKVQRRYAEQVAADRARRNAERAAADAKRAENRSGDDLPGLDD